jgi:hypothetical protein
MYAYSHLYWADRLWQRLGAQDPAEFNLGAVMADLRYADNLPWKQTHFADQNKAIHLRQFWDLASAYGALDPGPDQDYARGYLLHLAMDRSWDWLVEQIRERFWLGRWLQRIHPRILKIAIEAAVVELHPMKNIPLSRRVPELALRVGITEASIIRLRSSADKGLTNPSAEAAYEFVKLVGLAEKPLIRVLMRIATVVARTPLRYPFVLPICPILEELEPELEQRFLTELSPFIPVEPRAEKEAEGAPAPVAVPTVV